jgi:hypothetical protein
MKKLGFTLVAIYLVSAIAGCSNKQKNNQNSSSGQDTGKKGSINAILALETKLKASPNLDNYTANLTITEYSKFATAYPNDSLAPIFLYKAGNLARSIGQFKRAISIYNNVCSKYPTFKRLPDCIFVEAFTYDNDLKDTANAHAKYLEVVQKFPNDSLASQAKAAISILGKSDEELMKEFDKKNKKENKKART